MSAHRRFNASLITQHQRNIVSSCHLRHHVSAASLNYVTDVEISAQRRIKMLPKIPSQHTVVLTFHRRHITSTTSTCNGRDNVCTTSYHNTTDVTTPAKRRIMMPWTSKYQHNVIQYHQRHAVSNIYERAIHVTTSSHSRINIPPTSPRQYVKTSFQRQTLKQYTVIKSNQRCINVPPTPF